MSTYAELKTRVLQLLNDASGVRYPDLCIQESMRQALSSYNSALSQVKTATITIATAGRSQSLAAVTDFNKLISLIYPFVTDMDEKPTDELRYYVWFDAGVPKLYFPAAQCAVGEKILITYSASHRISGLDSAVATTMPALHEALFCCGVAAYACIQRAHSLLEAYGANSPDVPRLQNQAQKWLDNYNTFLHQNSTYAPSFHFPVGYKLDDWDV